MELELLMMCEHCKGRLRYSKSVLLFGETCEECHKPKKEALKERLKHGKAYRVYFS